MWDVKTLTKQNQGVKGAFYLNYVGCKDKFPCFILLPGPCFTLTMWDVKCVYTKIVCSCSLCFTLTMWDVKYT